MSPRARKGGRVLGCFATLGMAFLLATQVLGGADLSLQTLGALRLNPKNPRAGLVQGGDGNFYGTTTLGGTNGENGTVFQITPGGELTVVHSFRGTDGALPYASLVQGSDGGFYGTAQSGGTNGDFGTVFRITTNGDFTNLHYFSGLDGRSPQAALVEGNEGSLYGTTAAGGTNGDHGTVFKVTSTGAFTSLFSFSGTNGAHPLAGLIQGIDGNFYGTTSEGGPNYNGTPASAHGAVFRITPAGSLTPMFYFRGTNGSSPAASLVEGSDGNFYGTTEFGGANGDNGTVFKFTTSGELTTLFSFSGPNGNYPRAGLTVGGDGNLYGTTSGDRLFGGTNTFGTVFRLTPNSVVTTLVAFNNTSGASPVAGLTLGNDGNLYGTTFEGGLGGGGTIFRMVEQPLVGAVLPSSGTVVVTWTSFTNGNYRLEHTLALDNPSWTALVPDIIASNSKTSITNSVDGVAIRYYRIRLIP